MWRVKLYHFNLLQEFKDFETLDKALEQKRIWLATYLCGYGVIWDEISEYEHLKQLLNLSLEELEEMAVDAYADKELDYAFSVRRIFPDYEFYV